MKRSILTFFTAALLLAALTTSAGWAAGSSVSPTRLLFAQGQASSYLVITNTSLGPQRYSVAAYGWDETSANPITLSDTSEVVFFPGSFTLGAFQSQRIRVGTVSTSGAVERTYRIVVNELPSLKSVLVPQTSGLAFTAGFSVPIYVAPLVPLAAAEIGNVEVDRNNLRFTIRDTGNVHLVAKSMKVLTRGDSGTLMSTQNSSWFVLAKKQREFVLPIPRGSCAGTKSVSISVDTASVKFDRTVTPKRSCR